MKEIRKTEYQVVGIRPSGDQGTFIIDYLRLNIYLRAPRSRRFISNEKTNPIYFFCMNHCSPVVSKKVFRNV